MRERGSTSRASAGRTPRSLWAFGRRGWVALGVLVALAGVLLIHNWPLRLFELANWAGGEGLVDRVAMLGIWSLTSWMWVEHWPDRMMGWPEVELNVFSAGLLAIAMTIRGGRALIPAWMVLLVGSILVVTSRTILAPVSLSASYAGTLGVGMLIVGLAVDRWWCRAVLWVLLINTALPGLSHRLMGTMVIPMNWMGETVAEWSKQIEWTLWIGALVAWAWIGRVRLKRSTACVACGYDCAGVTAAACPECGADHAPASRIRGRGLSVP